MEETTAILVGSIIGGLAAAGAGVILDASREKGKEERIREILVTAICDDLEHSVGVYNKIQNDWLTQKTIYFSHINELTESRQTYKNNKDWIHIFDDIELRREIFTYYLRSADCLRALEYNQTRKYEIGKKFNEVRTSIRLKDSTLTEDAVTAMAIQSMQKEDAEYKQIDFLIGDGISKLFGFKETAASLVKKLKSEYCKDGSFAGQASLKTWKIILFVLFVAVCLIVWGKDVQTSVVSELQKYADNGHAQAGVLKKNTRTATKSE